MPDVKKITSPATPLPHVGGYAEQRREKTERRNHETGRQRAQEKKGQLWGLRG